MNCHSGLGENLNLISAVLANLIAKNMSVAEISLYAVLFSTVGDALGVVAAARALCENEDEST